ncbi:hypothetical protein Plec18167_005572 [Paecilomyces lecythidis]|uniref:Beta-mannosidase A n=1 Tax=Paecilomyces lecythidis TaxID=3004212 RepID=A0ABR3XIU4_9EURO
MYLGIQAVLLLAAAGLSSLVSAQNVVDLSGDGWTVSNKELAISVPGKLPSHVQLDLYAAGVTGDPYHGLNDFNLRWVAARNWTYTSDPIKGLSDEYDSSWLVFDGLDTFTTVELCGQFVAATNNQFRQYHFDVSNILKNCSGDPVVSLNFGSAPNIVNGIANQPGQVEWPYGIQLDYEYPNREFMRKEQSDFGWDWGPAFAPAGPWKPAYIVQLQRSKAVYVLNTDIDIYREGQINHLIPDQSRPWVVNASIDYLGDLPEGASMTIEIREADKPDFGLGTTSLDNVTVSGNSITGTTLIGPDVPKLWWPNGLGEQNLYNITISVIDQKNSTLASVTKRSGFRTIVLNRTNITEQQMELGIAPGANWHFEINGHEFYAKGSNFIPPDAFWPRVTEERMNKLFDSVVAGNQNMLRVWASGAYLPDFIYDIADERGVLLWSEFEFSDDLYPTDPEFLENVSEEVVYNVRRVNHHPSLALWAGGNEIESLMLQLAYEADPDHYGRYAGEYEKLFISLILPLVYENTRSISYNPSSTTNGYLEVNLSAPVPMVERYWNLTPGAYYGDTDFYNYDSSISFNYDAYPVGRFANEFGYHSMPSLQTWQQAVDPKDLHFNSSVIMLRNHHYPSGDLSTDNYKNSSKGMGEMTIAVERYYPIPNKTDSVANFSAWCHATQIFQADMYKSEIQFYRRGSGMPERQLGSLYWQLEDIWQAPTWAGIEYDGRWKVLHYVAKDIYQPVIISPFWNYTTGDLEIYVTSDLWESVSGRANLTWLDLKGEALSNNAGTPSSANFTVGALNTTNIYSTNVKNLTLSSPSDSILILSVEATGHTPNTPPNSPAITFKHENHFTPVFPNDLKLVDPGLSVTKGDNGTTFIVEAKSGVSLYTWLDYPAGTVGHFDENAFVLIPGQKKEVGFTVLEDESNGEWANNVTASSLWDQTTQ